MRGSEQIYQYSEIIECLFDGFRADTRPQNSNLNTMKDAMIIGVILII